MSYSYPSLVRLAIVLGIFLSIGSSLFMIANKDIAPDWDMVGVIYFLLGGNGDSPPDWLSTDVFDFVDNEHRPFLPMVIWGVDFEFFGSFGLLPQVLMQLFAVITAVLITGWSRLASNPRSMTALSITICAIALMLAPMHYGNLVYPKQIHVYTSILFSVLALSIAASIHKGSWRQQIAQSLLCSVTAVCATFSFGYGLVVWPVLLIHGLFSRWSWQGYLTIVFASVATIATYYAQYTILAYHSDPTESILDPTAVAHYASLLLAAPFVASGIGTSLGSLVGFLMLAVFSYVSFRVYIQRKVIDDYQLRSLLVCFYCIGVAILTALGRVTITSPVVSRYLIIPSLFILAMPGLFQLRPPIHTVGKQASILGILFCALGFSAGSFLFDDPLRGRQFVIREGAIAAALETKAINRGLFPAPYIINDHVWPYYFEHHSHSSPLNIITWLGKALPDTILIQESNTLDPKCIGDVDEFVSREGDTEFDIARGWARLGPKGGRQADWVILTNSSGVIVGLATTGKKHQVAEHFLKASFVDNLLTATNRAGFEGLVRSQPGDDLDFYAYKDGTFCQFARNVKAPDS
jgi:hypothetical protein